MDGVPRHLPCAATTARFPSPSARSVCRCRAVRVRLRLVAARRPGPTNSRPWPPRSKRKRAPSRGRADPQRSGGAFRLVRDQRDLSRHPRADLHSWPVERRPGDRDADEAGTEPATVATRIATSPTTGKSRDTLVCHVRRPWRIGYRRQRPRWVRTDKPHAPPRGPSPRLPVVRAAMRLVVRADRHLHRDVRKSSRRPMRKPNSIH